MPTMKYVLTTALIAVTMLAAPLGHADPDPHKPDAGANYCPGGGTVDASSPEPSCDGVPYEDGSYWRAIKRGGPSGPGSFVVVQCVKPPPSPGIFAGLVPQVTGPVPAPAGSCQ
jgi:hypothetical protein